MQHIPDAGFAHALALIPLCPCTAAIAASLGRQGVHFGNVDAGNEVFILRGAVVQVELLIGLHGLFGQIPQGREVETGVGGNIAERFGNILRVSGSQMLFALGLVAVALLHGVATAAAVSEAFFFAPATGAGRADTGSGNIRGRFLLYRFDGGVLAGLGLPEGRQHLLRKLVVIHGNELVAGQKRFRGQMFFSGLGFAELLGQQMAFLPDPCGFVPAPEAPTGIGVVNIVAVLADDHTRTSVSLRRSSSSACRALFRGCRRPPRQP